MRFVLGFLAIGLAACSAVPPEPIVPLRAGEFRGGVSVDIPLDGTRNSGLPPLYRSGISIWGAVGAGRGVDIAFSMDAPISLGNELIWMLRDGQAFMPPGMAIRKSFDNGMGVGLGTTSVRNTNAFIEGPADFFKIVSGPFVTYGTHGDAAPAARATVHLVYEISASGPNVDSLSLRRGLAVYGAGTLGGNLRADSSLAVFGGRFSVGTWMGPPYEIGFTISHMVQGYELVHRSRFER